MNWIEVTVNTPSSDIDSRIETLTALGADGFIIESEEDFNSFLENNHQYWDYVDEELESRFKGVSRIKCYLSDDSEGNIILNRILDEFNADVSTASVQDSDWENNWKQYYEPIETGNKLVVVPEWLEAPDTGRIPLRLDPGLTFGTGSHATTKMCLAALEKYARIGARVLDLGCGSGILGIGALLLGCDSCVGCDIDPKSPDVVLSNAALNEIEPEKLKVFSGNVLSDAGMRKLLGTGYDIVLANIVADVIIPLSGIVSQFIGDSGVFITSGIIEGRQDEVKSAIISAGFEIINHQFEDEWHCFECIRGNRRP